ncbi:cold-responsive protein kinase 1-like isoform X2 [Phragmites australis]|nr:cold-responsive protein kinase 1-like isoform X2 [Phragmites australis]XP_062227160.1 cold-responsive protein kinase 1-like isoform X2 [Phragmites australis]XP_062227161.1 cold-responsive protein kinase 1-like isoform X2 [Phragmites australis]
MNWCCLPNSKKDEDPYSHSICGIYSEKNIRLFSYAELRSATDNFNHTNKVGRGGFGIVYKGTIRNEQEVAVKVLSAESRQGIREFLTEINVISNVKHPNLVELIGCCVEGNNRILVYEYLKNSSLDRALLGFNSEPANFTWSIRSVICTGVASGLAYLHEEIASPIVHRDIKASNVLLDRNYIPKIGDFGLAKLFPDNITHISTRVAGTTGYLAPEYAWHGQLTKKADIYSFGVLVLEIVSGRSSSRSLLADDKILIEKAWELYEAKRLKELVDPALGDYPEDEVLRYIKVALFCIQAAAARRPSMPQVLTMLSKPIRINESELMAPGYIHDYNTTVSKATTSSDSRFKHSGSEDSNTFSTVVPQTVTEISPR